MGEFTTTIPSLTASSEGGHGLSFWGLLVYVGLVLAIVFVVLGQARKGLRSRVFKNPFTGMAEQLYLFLQNMCVGIIGPHGKKYMPFIATFWLVIFFSNLVSLFFPAAPTGDLSFNLGMALISISYVQYEGIKANGLFGHLRHFAGPKLPLLMVPITLMIFVIEVISELMKNLSLSLRLYGNIHGGHEAVVAMNGLGAEYFIPVGFFLLPLKMLTCVVQALIFSLLTCVYLSLVTHHEDHGGHEGDEAHGELAPAH